MLTQEENELLTRVGPGTAMGALLRSYWQPAALSEELAQDSPLPVRLLGEDLVLYRDEGGQPGLLGLHCPHRGADLSYGRLEDGGLRCLYHGWLYDARGRCLEQPGEPAGSDFHTRIRHTAYPCLEHGGIIFAYLGTGEPPLLPGYELLTVPEEHRYSPTKSFHECNFLQGNEGNFDPMHLSFLHRLTPNDARPQRLVPGTSLPHMSLYIQDMRPRIEVEETRFGMRIFAIREVEPGKSYVRITNFVMPNLCAIAGVTGQDGYQIDWHVPLDDVTHWKYTMGFKRSAPVDPSVKLRGDAIAEDYRRVRHAGNRYKQDRDEMQARSFSGLGTNFLDHDAWAVESQGAIQDRMSERLSVMDRAVILARRQLLQAVGDVQEGVDPLHLVRDPAENEFLDIIVRAEVIPGDADYHTYWEEPAQPEQPLGTATYS